MKLLLGIKALVLKLMDLLFSGYTESLDDDIEILVPDDDYGLYAIDILDPSWVKSALLFNNSCYLMKQCSPLSTMKCSVCIQ